MPYRALSEEERNQIHEGALAVLEQVGLQAPRPLLQELRERGLTDDGDDRLRLSRASVETALAPAPGRPARGPRAGKRPGADGRATHGPDGCGSRALDLETGAVRPSELADVAVERAAHGRACRVRPVLTMVSAQDVRRVVGASSS
jgi:trimethylamine:corrinoid methyltransferase-like protein